MDALKIAIAGAGGRMGRMITESALNDSQVTLVSALDQPGTPAIGKDAGELLGTPCGVPISTDVEAGIARAEVVR